MVHYTTEGQLTTCLASKKKNQGVPEGKKDPFVGENVQAHEPSMAGMSKIADSVRSFKTMIKMLRAPMD